MEGAAERKSVLRMAKGMLVAMLVTVSAANAASSGMASLECGGGGAALGYLAGRLAHLSEGKSLAIGAGVGAVGATACYAYANHLEARRKELAGKEQNLDAQIAYVRGLNQDTHDLNTELTNRVSTVTQATSQLETQIKQQQVSNDQLMKERKQRDDVVKNSQTQVDQGTQALQTAKTLRTQQNRQSPDLDTAIAQQEQLLAQAQHQVDLLAAQRALIS